MQLTQINLIIIFLFLVLTTVFTSYIWSIFLRLYTMCDMQSESATNIYPFYLLIVFFLQASVLSPKIAYHDIYLQGNLPFIFIVLLVLLIFFFRLAGIFFITLLVKVWALFLMIILAEIFLNYVSIFLALRKVLVFICFCKISTLLTVRTIVVARSLELTYVQQLFWIKIIRKVVSRTSNQENVPQLLYALSKE